MGFWTLGFLPELVKKNRAVQRTMFAGLVGKDISKIVGIWMDDLGNFHDPKTKRFVKNPNRTIPTRAEIRAGNKRAKERTLKTK
jgi:hypothetical protein